MCLSCFSVSRCKDFSSNKWYKFDDSKVVEIPSEELCVMFSDREEIRLNHEEDCDHSAPPVDDSVVETEGVPQPPSVQMSVSDIISVQNKQSEESKNIPLSFADPRKNAYMLMYRRVDPSKNVLRVEEADIPEERRREVEEDNEIYKQRKKEYDRIKNICRLHIHYGEKQIRVQVLRTSSINSVTRKVAQRLGLYRDRRHGEEEEDEGQGEVLSEEEAKERCEANECGEEEEGVEKDTETESSIPLDCLRLRRFDTLRNLPGEPLDGFAEKSLTESEVLHRQVGGILVHQ